MNDIHLYKVFPNPGKALYTNKCNSQTTSSTERRQSGSGNVFSSFCWQANPQLWHRVLCSNHHPSLSTLRSKRLSSSKRKWWAIYTQIYQYMPYDHMCLCLCLCGCVCVCVCVCVWPYVSVFVSVFVWLKVNCIQMFLLYSEGKMTKLDMAFCHFGCFEAILGTLGIYVSFVEKYLAIPYFFSVMVISLENICIISPSLLRHILGSFGCILGYALLFLENCSMFSYEILSMFL